MFRTLPFSVFILAAWLTACSSKAPESQAPAAPPVAAAHDTNEDGIAWRKGDVDAAFAEARTANKPVLLYWGAVWCPPCQQIKATIFKRPEFVERTWLLIPVYIDGDSPRAQEYAERFGVVGYPTVVMLKPDGTEITRLPGGVDIDLYVTLVDSAVAHLKPVKDLIALALSDPKKLQPDDWHLLAYYSWELDYGRLVEQKEAPALVQKLYSKCQPAGASNDCLRLELSAAALAQGGDAKDQAAIDKTHLRATLRELLGNSNLQRQNLDTLVYYSGDLVSIATRPKSPEREALVTQWQSTLDTLANDESLPRIDRVGMAFARVQLARADTPKGPLPADVEKIVRDRVAWADAATKDPYERQAIVNRAAAALDDAGLAKEANDLLTRELKISKSPYYFMLDIADLAEQDGHKEVALQWLDRAYRESQGPATRFQWGTEYLLGLVRMAPEDEKRIETVGLAVLDELAKSKDSIHQRSSIRLGRIDQAVSAWNKGDNHRPVVRALRARLEEICAPIAAGDTARKTCDEFLAKAKA